MNDFWGLETPIKAVDRAYVHISGLLKQLRRKSFLIARFKALEILQDVRPSNDKKKAIRQAAYDFLYKEVMQ